MDLETIYYIGQTIAVVAIILSLIFVGLQVRQNTAQAKADAAEAAHRALIELQRSFTAENSAIAVKANTDYDSLSPAEVFFAGTIAMQLLLNMQEAHAKWLDGSLIENRWRVWDEYASFSVSPAILKTWEQRRAMFSDVFQKFYDCKIADVAEAPGRQMHMHNFVPRDPVQKQVESAPDPKSLSDEEPGT